MEGTYSTKYRSNQREEEEEEEREGGDLEGNSEEISVRRLQKKKTSTNDISHSTTASPHPKRDSSHRKVTFNFDTVCCVDFENDLSSARDPGAKEELYYNKADHHRAKGEANLEAFLATELEKDFTLIELKRLLYQPYGDNNLPICHVLIISSNPDLYYWLYAELRQTIVDQEFPFSTLIQLAKTEEECNNRLIDCCVSTYDFIFIDEYFSLESNSVCNEEGSYTVDAEDKREDKGPSLGISQFMDSLIRENVNEEDTICIGVCNHSGDEKLNSSALESCAALLGVPYVILALSDTVAPLWTEICRKQFHSYLPSELASRSIWLPSKAIYRRRKPNRARPARVPYHSMMANLPHSIHEALQISSDARAITEIRFPFEIIHANEAWGAQFGEDAQEILRNSGT